MNGSERGGDNLARITEKLIGTGVIKKPESSAVPIEPSEPNLDRSIQERIQGSQPESPEDKKALLKIEGLSPNTRKKLLDFFQSEVGQNILGVGHSTEKTVRQWEDTTGFNFSDPDKITRVFKSLPGYFHFAKKAPIGPGGVIGNKFYGYYELIKAKELYRLLQWIAKNQ